MKLPFDTDQGIGTRANLGVIVLQTDETLEAEFTRLLNLPGVARYHSRIPMVPNVDPDSLARMEQDLPTATKLLPALPYNVIGYGCTSAATVIGSDRVAAAIQTIAPTAKVTDPLAAIIAAASHLGAQRLGFLTPYIPDVSTRMRHKLVEAGFDIAGFGSFEESDDRVVARISENAIKAAALQIASSEPCDALVISCTNLRCLNIAAQIEAQIGVPVLSSNMALAWHMRLLAGLAEHSTSFGALFAR